MKVLLGLFCHTLMQLRSVEVQPGTIKKECRQDEQRVYVLTIRTDRMSDSVLWRNDSNGCYGGELLITVADSDT